MTPKEQLYTKLSAEYDAFVEGLKDKPPKDIIESSYEKVFKEDILMCFEYDDNMSDKEIAALLALEFPLDELYRNWLDTDVSHTDDLRDTISGFVVREIERTNPTVLTANGKVGVGDYVIVAPDEDYGCLIGQVSAIDRLGTSEHDTENNTDDVHVNFTVFSYPPWQTRDYAEHFNELFGYGEYKNFDEIPLDDVIMAPEMLISLTDISEVKINEMITDYDAAEAFCGGVFGIMRELPTAKAQAVNGEINLGNWVIVKPGEDYACLIGQVWKTDVVIAPGTEDEVGGVIVNFAAIDYSDAAKEELHGILGGLYREPLAPNEVPLGGTMLPPESLIRLIGSGIERTDELADTYIAVYEFGNRVLSEHFNDLEERLADRVEQNYADYQKSLMGFGKREIIDMAVKIAAMQDALDYMTTSRGYSDEELDFYMQFASPLEVVADAWTLRNADNEDMSFAMDHVFERREELLAAYPLKRDIPVEQPPAEIPRLPEKTADPAAPKQKRSLTERLKDADAEAKAYNAQKAQDPTNKNKTKNKEELTQ
jgi:hypothetical protein